MLASEAYPVSHHVAAASVASRRLSGYDDALYAHEAKEMVDHGDWWTIHSNGALNFEYPPMFIWLDAVSLRWLGS